MLRRRLGPIQIQLISLGGIIGSCFFIGVGTILSENGPSSILAFILGGFISWLVAMAMGELCVAMPREGSLVSHSRELLGRPWGAGVGWSYWLNWCAYVPSEMIAGGMLLHTFFPQIPILVFAAGLAAIVTFINLLDVRYFGIVESSLSLMKIVVILAFSVVALSIFGQSNEPTVAVTSFLPQDFITFFMTMVLVLVNFQGTELIALTSAEAENPEKTIPRAARNVTLRTLLLFIIPLTLLIFIFPLKNLTPGKSVFVEALLKYRFSKLALITELTIIIATLSCANSGLYGSIRALYGLAKENLAPHWFAKTNSKGVPTYATWITVAVSWSFLPLFYFFEGSHLYVWLLSLSGFTGAICWISITLCQIKLRRNLQMQGVNPSQMTYAMPLFPYFSLISLILQLGSLGFLAAHPTMRTCLILGIPAFGVPTLICWVKDHWKKKALPISAGATTSRRSTSTGESIIITSTSPPSETSTSPAPAIPIIPA